MPRKPSGDFDPVQYRNSWNKGNMLRLSVAYSSDFVTKFKEACSVLGVSQSSVFREAMQKTIEEAKETGR
ncbi:MAG: hypothetical protein EOM64_02305 [Erysipelotrichia bacterium]|nr:hypothetical protein [Erysipelotrichia bacterium]